MVIYVDGSSVPNPGPSGVGLLVLARGSTADSLIGVTKNIGFGGNNTAEFLGLMDALAIVRAARPRSALIVSDSLVGLRLATGKIRARSGQHLALQRQARDWLVEHEHVRLCWVERNRNLAHHLARFGASLPEGSEDVRLLGSQEQALPRAS